MNNFSNDPLREFEKSVQIKTLQEMIRTLQGYLQDFSCGCPESRLCNHPENDGVEHAISMVEDELHRIQREK